MIKHAIPCGMASHEVVSEAFFNALYADKKSAFGGVFAMNCAVDEVIATELVTHFFEILIAPDFSAGALKILTQKKNVRLLKMPELFLQVSHHYQFLAGGLLVQSSDNESLDCVDLKYMTEETLNQETLDELLFAWHVVAQVKSNAIVIANNQTAVGIGGGQVSRIDATKQAIDKANVNARGAVLASDGFFPFRDCVDLASQAGIRAIIQPGGSKGDEEVIAACRELDIALVFTGKRVFRH